MLHSSPLWGADFPVPKLLKTHPRQSDLDKTLTEHIFSKYKSHNLPCTREQIALAQEKDAYFGPVYRFLRFGSLPQDASKAKSIVAMSKLYVVMDDVLFYLKENHKTHASSTETDAVLAVPKSYIFTVLHHYHSTSKGCHMKVTKLYLLLRSLYHIPNLYSYILNFIRACHVCNQMSFEKNPHLHRAWQPRLLTSFIPFSHLHLDILFFPKSLSEFRYILVAVCEASRFTIAVPLRTKTASEIAEALVTNIFLPYRTATKLTMDLDRGFCNNLMIELSRLLHVSLHYIQCNAHESLKAERFVKVVSRLLISQLGYNFESWPKLLPFATKAYNNSKIVGLNFSPSYLVFLHDDRQFLDAANTPFDSVCSSQEEYLQLIKQRLQVARTAALHAHNKLQIQQCESHSLANSHKFKRFSAGNLVYLLCPSASALVRSEKIKFNYIGILYIRHKISSNEYTLSTIDNQILSGSFHINRLKKGSLLLSNGTYAHTIGDVRDAINQGVLPEGIPSLVNMQSIQTAEGAFLLQDSTPQHTAQEISGSQAMPTFLYFGDKNNSPIRTVYMKVARIRWASGKPHLLCQSNGKGNHFISIWVDPDFHPLVMQLLPKLLTNRRIRHIGSLNKYARQLYS